MLGLADQQAGHGGGHGLTTGPSWMWLVGHITWAALLICKMRVTRRCTQGCSEGNRSDTV